MRLSVLTSISYQNLTYLITNPDVKLRLYAIPLIAWHTWSSQPLPATTTKPTATQAFENMKSFVDVWVARGPDGKLKRLSYKIFLCRTALQDFSQFEGEKDKTMVTTYHRDGNASMLTHYCAANNQPRMRAASINDNLRELTCKFFDPTNLASPKDGHLYEAVFNFIKKSFCFNETIFVFY